MIELDKVKIFLVFVLNVVINGFLIFMVFKVFIVLFIVFINLINVVFIFWGLFVVNLV